MKGEHKAPEFVEKQPFGQVPYIVGFRVWITVITIDSIPQDDDGFILYESRAICHYLETKYADQGTSLIPKDLKANALYQQAASIEAFAFNDSAEKIAIEMIFGPYVQSMFNHHIISLKVALELGVIQAIKLPSIASSPPYLPN